MEKLKIALICHFSNPLVRGYMQLSNKRVFNFVRKMLGMPQKIGYGDIAPWDTNFIDSFKTRDDVELTVISAHSGLKKSVIKFQAEGVNYYFVCCDFTNFLKRVVSNPKLWNKMNPMRRKVHKIIEQLKPDIIALMGAENPHYSGTVLGLKNKYPIIFKAQTIYNNPDRAKFGKVDKKNAYVERSVLKSINYAAVNTHMHYKLYRTFNKDSYNFNWPLGTTYPEVIPVKEKEFDFVNFAVGMSDSKGYPDTIKALAIVKKNSHPQVKLNLIGSCTAEYKASLMKIISELGLEKNVIFTPFFEQQSEMFQHLQKAKFAVLPYKLDYIASTTYQAMHYGLPVVVYKTEGTPLLNKKKECALIAEMENIEDLANKMSILVVDSKRVSILSKNAKSMVDEKNNNKLSDHLMKVFNAVVANYNQGTEIPKELIHDPTE